MDFKMLHTNLNVRDLEKSLTFYKEALGLDVVRRKKVEDGSFELAFISDGSSEHLIELTWLRDKDTPYELGDNESHIAFSTADIKAAHTKHAAMGCICFENTDLGVYFIEDLDGYWIEIVPAK